MEFRRTSIDSPPPPTNTSNQQPEPASSSSSSSNSVPSEPLLRQRDLSHTQRPPSWIKNPHPLSSTQSTKVPTPTEIAKAAIQAELEKLPAKSAFYAKRFGTNETIAIGADKIMNSLSLIKLAVVMLAFKAVDDGKLNLDEQYIITEDDLCAGTGQFTWEHVGTPWTLGQLLKLIITISDNAANDIILRKLGISNVNEFLANCEYNAVLKSESCEVFREFWIAVDPKNASKSNAEIYKLGFPPPGVLDDLTAEWEAKREHWVGEITARTVGQMIEDIYFGKHLSEEYCKKILDFMYDQKYDSRFPKGLPDGTRIAHKTGDYAPYAGHDAGLIDARNGKFVAVMLTSENTGDFAELEAAEARIAEHLMNNWG